MPIGIDDFKKAREPAENCINCEFSGFVAEYFETQILHEKRNNGVSETGAPLLVFIG